MCPTRNAGACTCAFQIQFCITFRVILDFWKLGSLVSCMSAIAKAECAVPQNNARPCGTLR